MLNQENKADTGKHDPTLLMHDLGKALKAVTAVLNYGAEKYEPRGLYSCCNSISRMQRRVRKHRQISIRTRSLRRIIRRLKLLKLLQQFLRQTTRLELPVQNQITLKLVVMSS